MKSKTGSARPTFRELGMTIGRFRTGKFNAITDVKGVKVGHITHIKNDVWVPNDNKYGKIRTGVTVVVPFSDFYKKRYLAGGFVLNGIGEMTGLTQVMEWGWLETPILLTNTMSIGDVHKGIVNYMVQRHPKLGTSSGVIIPLIGEADDSFLNEVRVPSIKQEDVTTAMQNAKAGYVLQGSVGAGTGMSSYDFAGGIGTSSRVLPKEHGGFTIGVLVMSNVGVMKNLTIEGAMVGPDMDRMFKSHDKRKENYGSIIVVIATDAPLLAGQLSSLAKRAALGVGRTGSHASSSSGEIMVAFSTANKISREEAREKRLITMKFISQPYMNPLYEAVIETTEEAIMNSMFCSGGMDGREGHNAPMIPAEEVMRILKRKK